jgi:ABC-type transport system involved in cytochrome c biogenesis permease subunit
MPKNNRSSFPVPGRRAGRFLAAAIFIVLFLVPPSGAAPAKFSKAAWEPLENLAVQSGGRIKPFLSFAREVLVFVTGRESFEGLDAVPALFGWFAETGSWEKQPLIPVSAKELKDSLGLGGERRVSPQALAADHNFLQKAEAVAAKSDAGETLTFLEQKQLDLYQRINLFYNTAQGRTWSVIAPPVARDQRWAGLDQIASVPGSESLKPVLDSLLAAYRAGDEQTFRQQTEIFVNALGRDRSLDRELHYLRLHPFRKAWWLYLAAFLILLLLAPLHSATRPLFSAAGLSAVAAGFAFHTYGFIIRCLIAGRPPVSNMYESVIWVSWAAVLFSLILYAFNRSNYLAASAAAVAAFGLILADTLPAALDPSISPLVPVLRNNFWLTIHVLTITLSYGAFALAMGVGHLALFFYAFRPGREEALKSLTLFIYRAVQIGVILLAAGTILGGVWANYSWGRFWGWDPKETWALIALLGYLTLLHCRFIGWIGPFGLAVGAVTAFLGVLMAWYGVNYVLAAGLHSYGFGGGGVSYVSVFVAFDLALVALAAWKYRLNAHG